MRLFFDENLPSTLAEAIAILQSVDPTFQAEVGYLPDIFYRGVRDEEWIPEIGKEGPATIITCDHQLHKRKDQRQLYQEFGLGLVIIKPPSKKGLSHWKQVQKIVQHWEHILEIVQVTPKPFLLLINMTGKPKLLYDGKNWRDK